MGSKPGLSAAARALPASSETDAEKSMSTDSSASVVEHAEAVGPMFSGG